MGNTSGNFTRNDVTYIYKECVGDYSAADPLVEECANVANESNQTTQCVQFCETFPEVVPHVYLGVSCLSAVCCLLVFLSYCYIPRLRHSGYSTKVFLLRTLMDFVIAIGHIISGIAKFPTIRTIELSVCCGILGCINQAALIASNLWYIVLAVDLLKAIRNPFSARPTYGPIAHLFIWSFSIGSGAILGLLAIPKTPGGPGPSMFFWCWISIESVGKGFDAGLPLGLFAVASLLLYYFWHSISWVFSLFVVIIAAYILWKRLVASSETRKLVLKQNMWYVFVLAPETGIILTLWISQLALTRVNQPGDKLLETRPYFFTHADLAIAILFAVIHSFRGTVDLFVWIMALSIGREDLKNMYKRLRAGKKKEICSTKSLKTPLITGKSDSTVNKSLRRNAMYCINVGILDAVTLHLQSLVRTKRVGSVRDNFVAGQMIKLDEENQKQERAEFYRTNPSHRERSIRRIQFPASATIQSFSFIDLEPSIFSLLRTTFGVPPKKYRESFKIKNAADIEKEGMLEKFTEGKSGSFFYFTRDKKYIIKTVTSAEESFLQKIAYRYYHYMQNNPNSLIVRFYGLHKVRLAPEQRYITVVVMDNVFHNKEGLSMHECYDLKGSWVGRREIRGNRERNAYKGTLKDLDLGDKKIWVGPENKQLLTEQLTEDTQFLQSCEVMDYSLLLGIHNHSKFGETNVVQRTEQSFTGAAGEDFLDVSINEKPKPPASKYPSSGYSSTDTDGEISPIRIGSTRKYITLDSETETNLSETTQSRGNFGIPWFREDYGGLRSCSPLHPRYIEDGRSPSVRGEEADTVPIATYYFGIIDILQQYNWRKKAEHQWKTKVLCQNKHGLSAVNEKEYAQRFVDFLGTVFQ